MKTYKQKILSIQDSWLSHFWACGMLLSFFWELPLWYMTSMDRINPRFYDVFFLIGLVIFGPRLGERVANPVYRCWRNIVFWFTICALVYSSFIGWSIAQFSLLCALRYLQGLLVLKMFLLLPPKQTCRYLNIACWGGLALLCIYCFFEYNSHQLAGRAFTEIEIAEGKTIMLYGNFLFGPLSFSYFHLAQLIPLAFSVAIAPLLGTDKQQSKRFCGILLLLAIFMSWPVLFNGSRTGLGLLSVCLAIFGVLLARKSPVKLVIVLMTVMIVFWALASIQPPIFENAATLNRYDAYAESEVHSVDGRVRQWESFFLQLDSYDYWRLMPLFGAGFNFAPINGSYRIGYGLHSSPIYPLEQAGIPGFVLFAIFSVTSLRMMWKVRNSNPMAYAGIAYFCATLICGFSGAHNFWREFNTGNLNTLIILVMCMSASDAFTTKGVNGLNADTADK